jgi:hypothetical protein
LVRVSGDSDITGDVVKESDENGEVTFNIGSDDTVTIQSAIPAITFAPVTEHASTLLGLSPLVVLAERRVDLVGMCRLAVQLEQDDIIFSFLNSGGQEYTIEHAPFRNELIRYDGGDVMPEPPQVFQTAPFFYSIGASEFFNSEGMCIGGAYSFLGKQTSIDCSTNSNDLDVALCAGEGILPCSSFERKALGRILRRAVRGFFFGKRAAADLRRRYPETNQRFSINREAGRALSKIESTIDDVAKKAETCSDSKSVCAQVPFPKEHLRTVFRKGFRPRPPSGRKAYRAMIRRMERRFEKILRKFPAMVVVCVD